MKTPKNQHTTNSWLLAVLILLVISGCQRVKAPETEVERLAYVSEGHVFLANLLTEEVEVIGPGSEPSVSSDGNMLAYSILEGDRRRIALTNLRTMKTEVFQDIPGACFRPLWSPTENILLFSALARTGTTPHRVVVMINMDDDSRNYISIDALNIFAPTWSADGEKIYAHDTQNLYEWDKNGSLLNTLSILENFGTYFFSGSSVFQPSQEATHWIFSVIIEKEDETGKPVQVSSLMVKDALDQKVTRLSPEDFFVASYCWGPDETSVYFSGKTMEAIHDLEVSPRIFEVSLDGAILEELLDNACQPAYRAGMTSLKPRKKRQ